MQVQELLKKNTQQDFRFLSVTLSPEEDSFEVLSEYARTFGIAENWYFLTGKFEDIETLRKNMGFYDLDPIIDADKSEHGAIVAFGNDRTGKWGAVPTLLTPERIASAALLTTIGFSRKPPKN